MHLGCYLRSSCRCIIIVANHYHQHFLVLPDSVQLPTCATAKHLLFSITSLFFTTAVYLITHCGSISRFRPGCSSSEASDLAVDMLAPFPPARGVLSSSHTTGYPCRRC